MGRNNFGLFEWFVNKEKKREQVSICHLWSDEGISIQRTARKAEHNTKQINTNLSLFQCRGY